MAMTLDSIQHGVSFAPPRIIIYGVQGIGKTTMLSQAPSPVIIQTEDGAGVIDVPRFPLAKSFDDIMEALNTLATTKHDFLTVGLDSLDWMEPLVWEKVVQENPTVNKSGGAASGIESYGYGKGYAMAIDVWREYTDAINYLRNERNMMVIQTAHSKITRFESPESDAYDKYELKLQHSAKTSAAAFIQEHSDMVLFANYKVSVTDAEKKGDQKRKRAIGSGNRMLYTQERPAFSAKNRYGLPKEIIFDEVGTYWNTLAAHIPFLSTIGVEAIPDDQAQAELAHAETNETEQPQTQGE